MSLLDMNMNMNMNMAFAASFSGGRVLRPRFNSDVESRLANVVLTDTLVPPAHAVGGKNYPEFHPHWDADLRSYMYLDDFLNQAQVNAVAAGTTWQALYRDKAQNVGTALPANIPPDVMSRADLGAQVVLILEWALEREARFAEILDQDDADGAINYWLGMLKIDPARHPWTNLMVRIGRRIGEHVSMCLKGHFMSPRPPQLAPAITPMIDPPVTPSFPAGHAVQSYLMSLLLAYCFYNSTVIPNNTNLPQHSLPAPNSTVDVFLGINGPKGALFDLARRVSENRMIAGIHYPVDIEAGKSVAVQIFKDIQTVGSIWSAGGLRDHVKSEFPQFV